jgi:dTDP-4-amino-4,6-dideoxygalactose transaminase
VNSSRPPLAIFGSPPAFAEKLHVGRPNVGDRDQLLRRINGILDRRWLTNDGPEVQEFERRIADFLGARHCVATCNATVALEIAIRALGLTGEVIVPSFTFIATAHALKWQQLTPVFCDVDSETHNIDPRQVEALITPLTTGIIGVHLWGRACDAAALSEIARRRKLRLLLDASQAFGCAYADRKIGGFPEAEVFSFHATKIINTFEGGAVTTNNDALAATLRLMRNFGFSGYDEVTFIGTNAKMSEVSAAMGLTSLEQFPLFVDTNRRNHALYRAGLNDVPGIRLLAVEDGRSNYQYVVLEISEAAAGISRDDVTTALHAENVIARRYFHPGCHRMEPYRTLFPNAFLGLPVTERLARDVMTLPTGPGLSPDQVALVCDLIRRIVAHGSEVRDRLRELARPVLA